MVETITVKEPHRLPQVVELRAIPSLRSVVNYPALKGGACEHLVH